MAAFAASRPGGINHDSFKAEICLRYGCQQAAANARGDDVNECQLVTGTTELENDNLDDFAASVLPVPSASANTAAASVQQ
jgi:hypothetical protein